VPFHKVPVSSWTVVHAQQRSRLFSNGKVEPRKGELRADVVATARLCTRHSIRSSSSDLEKPKATDLAEGICFQKRDVSSRSLAQEASKPNSTGWCKIRLRVVTFDMQATTLGESERIYAA
jgi:hypothetical protein